jgi:molybdenum cofactor cytidylyltransferase
MSDIVGVLLAAGAGRRFGAHKLLQPLPDGVPVGVAAARSLVAALPNSVAVVREGDRELAASFAALGMQVVANPRAGEGMGTSLAAGIGASGDADGWLIALGDMPWIRPATMAALASHLRDGASMVAPVYRGQRGHPVGFSAQWGPALAALAGDQGARALLGRHPDQLQLVDTDDDGVLADIDHPSDIQR